MSELHKACEIGDLEQVTSLVSSKNINTRNTSSETPLYVASKYAHLSTVKVLVGRKECDVNIPNEQGNTPLHTSCQHIFPSVTQFLVGVHRCQLNTQNRQGETPLHIASKYDHVKTVKVLVSRQECDLNIQDEQGNTPLHTACKCSNYSTVKLLVADDRCQLNTINYCELNTPMHIACYTKAFSIIRLLLEKTCSTNIPNKKGETAQDIPLSEDGDYLLHIACLWGDAAIVRHLITDERCNPNVTNASGSTPLHIVSKHNHDYYLDVIEVLVSREECHLNIPDEQGNTPLHTACKYILPSVVEFLVGVQRCQLNTQNREGETPLHIASKYGYNVKALVNRQECDFNIPNQQGNTPLHIACRCGNSSTVKLLVTDQRCQSVNTQNKKGETPLLLASKYGFLKIVKVLVSMRECDFDIPDGKGNTPLHGACMYGHNSTVQILTADRRCQLNTQNEEGETPLHIASERDDLGTIEALVRSEKCNLNIADKCGNTPLHSACKHGHHSTVKYLVANERCQLNTMNYCELNTPMHIACYTKAFSIIRLLLKKTCSTNIPNKKGKTAQDIPLNENGDSLLHFACLCGDAASVRYLITHEKYNLNAKNASGSTPLHTASKHDHLDVVKFLVGRKECDLNILDEKGNTPLHKACKHGCHSTVQFLVADPRCQLNAKNSDMNTAMHLACIRKALNIVKLLLKRRCSTNIPNKKDKTAQEIPLNEDGDYLLHIACLWGDMDTIRYLVTDEKCDPNVLNKYHLPPLLATIKHGKPAVAAALLQHAKCDLSLRDQAGNTALHLACISGQTQLEMVKVAKNLIISVDPLCVNNAGQTPIELTTNYELIQAISHFTKCKTKHSVQTYINLFIVGNPETGKSTLVKAICYEANILWTILPKFLRRVKNVPPHTAGIIPTIFRSKTFGNTVLYDLAGQIEYYTSHAAVIRTTVISTPPAFTVVVNMSESEEKISETLRYWWSFINNHASQASAPPQVILVGSHADEVIARGGSVEERMSQLSALLKRLPTSFCFAGQVGLDCRDPASKELQLFCSLVNDSCCELRQAADVDLHCHVLYAFLLDKFPGRVACTISDIATTIQESDALLPQNPDSLIPLILTLSDKGLLLLVRDSVSSEDSWVILQKQALLGEINGTIFAPKVFSQHKKSLSSSTGVVPLVKLQCEFPDYNPTMIANFLTHLEFCFKVDDQETLELLKDEIVHKDNIPQSLSKEYYFFPALVSIENPLRVWEQDGDMICQSGWFYRSVRHDQFLTTQFLHVLILRLAFSLALKLDPGDAHEDSLALRRRCSVWKRGIGWLNRVPIETVVEVGLLKQSVIVMMRCPKVEEAKCAQLRSKVIQKVLEAKYEYCKAVEMSESFIHPSDVKYPFFHNAEDFKYYSLTEVARATVKEADNVLDCRGRNPFPMKDLLLFDPSSHASRELLSELFSEKHSLDEQVRGEVLEKLFEAIPRSVQIQEAGQGLSYKSLQRATPEPAVTQKRGWVGATTQELNLDAIPQERGQVEGANQELTKEKVSQHCTKPTLPELLKFTCPDGRVVNIPVEIATKYVQFGAFLLDDTNGSKVEIMACKHHYNAEQINIEILREWLNGRGKQPVTWANLVEVLHDIELSTLAGDIRTNKCPSQQ